MLRLTYYSRGVSQGTATLTKDGLRYGGRRPKWMKAVVEEDRQTGMTDEALLRFCAEKYQGSYFSSALEEV